MYKIDLFIFEHISEIRPNYPRPKNNLVLCAKVLAFHSIKWLYQRQEAKIMQTLKSRLQQKIEFLKFFFEGNAGFSMSSTIRVTAEIPVECR